MTWADDVGEPFDQYRVVRPDGMVLAQVFAPAGVDPSLMDVCEDGDLHLADLVIEPPWLVERRRYPAGIWEEMIQRPGAGEPLAEWERELLAEQVARELALSAQDTGALRAAAASMGVDVAPDARDDAQLDAQDDGDAREPGPIEEATRADIASLGALTGGARRTHAQVAIALARQFDEAVSTGAGHTTIAGLAKEHRQSMRQVVETANDSRKRDQLTAWLQSSLGDPADAEAPDAGPGGDVDRGDARQAVDAVAAARGERGPGDRPGHRSAGLQRGRPDDGQTERENQSHRANSPTSGIGDAGDA